MKANGYATLILLALLAVGAILIGGFVQHVLQSVKI